MKRLIPALLLTIIAVSASSQKIYFVYLQSESDQPFFVKMNKKIQSSTTSGYLILPKLIDSTYSFSVGFPQQKWPEQNFSIALDKKDHGYLLKNFGEKGWGLFDMQTMSVQMASMSAKTSAVNTEPTKVSAFTETLSKAADDPSLKEKLIDPKPDTIAVVKKPDEKKPETVVEVRKPEEKKPEIVEKAVEIKLVEKKADPIVDEKLNEIAKKDSADKAQMAIKEQADHSKTDSSKVEEEPYRPSVVTKKSESSNTEGFGLVYTDQYSNGKIDTIRLLIPNPKMVIPPKLDPVQKEEKKFLDISSDTTQKTNNLPVEKKVVVTEEKTIKPVAKNNCTDLAVEADFFKLRKKMVAGNSDDEMIAEAKKYYKTKCFAVSQIKNLSTLFLNDAGKYQFFDASYPYISDAENFSSLQGELKDEYYITRFKAMLR